MIAELAARLHTQTSLEGVVETTLDDTLSLTNVSYGTVRLLDETGGLMLVAQRGFDQYHALSMRRLTVAGTSASGRAVLRRRIVVIENAELDERYAPFSDFGRLAHFTGVASVPLITHADITVGTITMFLPQFMFLTNVNMRMLETYSRIAADRIWTMRGPGPISQRAQALYMRVYEKHGRSPYRNDRNGLGHFAF